MNKIFSFILSVLLFVTALPVVAFGYIDTNNEPALFVEFKDGEKALSGAKFDTFLVATIDENGNYYVKDEFSGFNIKNASTSQEGWRELALTLEGYVKASGMEPYLSHTVGEDGIADFFESEKAFVCGLYLLVGHPHTQDGFVYTAESTMFQLPAWDSTENDWNYDVLIKPKYSFNPVTEEETFITRKVLKIWDDSGYRHLRPKEITVYLLRDGELYDTVKLSASNNWRYTWEKLEDSHRWIVTEKVPEGYSVTVAKEGITFVITNSPKTSTSNPIISVVPEKPDAPDEPKLPQTGQLWWPVPVLFVVGTVFIALGIIRRRGSHEK